MTVMNGLTERDGWASHSSAQTSAPANKDAGACPTFFVRGGRMWLRTVARGILSCGAQRAAVLTDWEREEARRKSSNRGDDVEVGIWEFGCFMLIIRSLVRGFVVMKKGYYTAVNIRCVCICVCMRVCSTPRQPDDVWPQTHNAEQGFWAALTLILCSPFCQNPKAQVYLNVTQATQVWRSTTAASIFPASTGRVAPPSQSVSDRW